MGRVSHSSGLGRCIVALVAAYALVISSFIASFGVANAAAEESLNPSIVICHHDASGQLDPLQGHSDGGGCADCGCCIGCLMPFAALTPPPVVMAEWQPTTSHAMVGTERPAVRVARVDKSHRSRAPPLDA